MKVVADSHALVWFSQGSSQLSERAREALGEAEVSEGIVVSVASLIDLWYVTQTTKGVSTQELSDLRRLVTTSAGIDLHPITVEVADRYTGIDRDLLRDPWDRLIAATALVLGVPLVTRDGPIHSSGLVEAVW